MATGNVEPLSGDDVRALAFALPEVSERLCYGTPGFYVRGRLFMRLRDDETVLAAHCDDLHEKEAMIASDPAAFFTERHYDGYAMVLVRLSSVGRAALEEVVTDAWLKRAPKRAAAAYLAGTAGVSWLGSTTSSNG